MDTRVKNLWIEALLSDEYKQTSAALKAEDGYCCLGVLCEVYRKDTGHGAWDGAGFQGEEHEDYEYGVPPESVKEWAGLNDQNPSVSTDNLPGEALLYVSDMFDGGYAITLAGLNDRGNSFGVIAQVIEDSL